MALQRECTQAALEKRFGAKNVTFDPTTWTYLVMVAPGVQQRIVFDKLKKMPGTAVSSRYIDLLSYNDFTFLTSHLPLGLDARKLDAVAGQSLLQTWSFAPGSRPDSTSATYNPLLGLTGIGGSQVGVAWYPFNLTTPNYKMHMSLDFGYTIDDALVAVVVTVGKETRVALLSPQGTFQLPPETKLSLDTSKVPPFGVATGQASFTFDLKPGGNAAGTLSFLTLPLNPLRPASVHVVNLEDYPVDTDAADWEQQARQTVAEHRCRRSPACSGPRSRMW